MKRLLLPALIISLIGCNQPVNTQEAEVSTKDEYIYKPQEDLEELFHEIQMAGLYEDSKTFVDADPKKSTELILEEYRMQRKQKNFVLKDFVEKNFSLPESKESDKTLDSNEDLKTHLINHWEYLSRDPDDTKKITTLLGLPEPYIVPGGRFREIYYWDSYFTIIGLAASERWDMVENMTKNFAYLIDKVGFIPNGNRSYYLSRSQPPFFSSILDLQMMKYGDAKGLPYLKQLEKEYSFWMKGKEELTAANPSVNHTVLMENGAILNRYWDNSDQPRPESYREDVLLAEKVENKSKLYRNLRSAAESGWDFSTRWFDDENSFESIATTNLIPVDLNSLLYHMETLLSRLNTTAGNQGESARYAELAEKRKEAILNYCWDSNAEMFTDYNFIKKSYSSRITLAGSFPLYYKICSLEQAVAQSKILSKKLLRPQGLVTTVINSGQQWDAPNGWAPLQWIAIKGLENYGMDDMADDFSERWLVVNEKVYKNTGKMMEKYNVSDSTLQAGGGEYPTQDGFGWTNGVYLGLILDYKLK